MDRSIDARLFVLERRSRVLVSALTALIATLVLTAFAARAQSPASDPVPEVVRARRVQLVDAEGRVRAEPGIDAEGAAGLFVLDAAGRTRATVVHDDSQSGLFLLDAEGTVRVGAAQDAHGGGGFALHGPEAKGAAVLYLKDEGSLTFYAPDGAVLERIP